MKISAEQYNKLRLESIKTGKSILELIKQEEKQKKKPIIITDEKQKHGHPETDLQRDCVCWFKNSYQDIAGALFHPNNEPYFGGNGVTGKQRMIKGHLAITIGVTAGVADLILLAPSYDEKYHGLCIEMKSKRGRQSEAQKEWQKLVESLGYRYEVVNSFLDFRTIIRSHLHREPKEL